MVALSGGVDSSVVALLAHQALGPRATAVTLVGPAVSAAEVDRARSVARAIGIAHHLVQVDPLAVEEYRANPSNRCYFCRTTEASALRRRGERLGIVQYLDGVHLDDLGDDRPGLRAMDEARFLHPLVDAAWRKADVRSFARDHALPNWDTPSDACLASRIAHGQPITLPLLDRVERSEAWVRAQGFRRVRVRVRGESARVVVDPSEVGRLMEASTARRVVERLRSFGFAEVEIDSAGYAARAGA